MMDEQIEQQVNRLRGRAREMGATALEAIESGDIGLARTAARQAAQYARVAMQLETGDKHFEEAQERTDTPTTPERNRMDETINV